jgi:hypothetical protein
MSLPTIRTLPFAVFLHYLSHLIDFLTPNFFVQANIDKLVINLLINKRMIT